MGKATIKSHIAAGQYSVDVVYDNTRVKTRLAFINSLLNDPTKLTKEIADAQTEYNTKQAAADEALAAMNAYIETPGYSQLQLIKLSAEVMAAKIEAEMAQRKLNMLKLRKTAMEKEKAELTANAPDTKTVDAWCADLTTSLSGNVGTVEIDYETTKAPSVILLPGHAGALTHQAPYNGARDGILHHPHDQTPHQMYTNRAYLPASAKWKPRYRVGTITVLAGNFCTVALDAAVSSQQKLDINQAESLSNVPIKYMTCNGGAFAVGDRVVVAFDGDWATPTVIGFESNPKACPSSPPPPTSLYWPTIVDLEFVPYAQRVTTGYRSGRFMDWFDSFNAHYWVDGGPGEGYAAFWLANDRSQVDWAFTGDGWINGYFNSANRLSNSIHSVNSVTPYYLVTMEPATIPFGKYVLQGDQMVNPSWGSIGPVVPGNVALPDPIVTTPPKHGDPDWTTLPMVLRYSSAVSATKNYTFSTISSVFYAGQTRWYARYLVVPPAIEPAP